MSKVKIFKYSLEGSLTEDLSRVENDINTFVATNDVDIVSIDTKFILDNVLVTTLVYSEPVELEITPNINDVWGTTYRAKKLGGKEE